MLIPRLKTAVTHSVCVLFQQPTEYFDMGIFLAFFVVVSLVCLILLVKIKLKQRRSQVTPCCPFTGADQGWVLSLAVCSQWPRTNRDG